MKLQAREQAILGIGSIIAVVTIGLFGVVTDFAVMPSFDAFMEAQNKLVQTTATLENNKLQITSLQTEIQTLEQHDIKMPEGKNIGKVDKQAGQTIQSVKTDLLNTTIEMSQESNANILIASKPLAKPKQVQPIQPTDPNAPPAFQISNVIEEAPYELKLRGNYSSLNDFINTLAEYDTVIEIKKLEISPEQDDSHGASDPSRPLEAMFNLNYLIQKN